MISSSSNQQIKNIVKLRKSSKARQEQGVYLVEGIRMAREIPRNELCKLYLTEECAEVLQVFGNDRYEEGKDYEYISESVLHSISDTRTPQGVVALVRQKRYCREDMLNIREKCTAVGMTVTHKPTCVLLLENLQDPGNLGTIFRTAEGAGVSGIIMSADTVDIYNPKVVRATMGSIFRMPFCYTEDIKETVMWLKAQGIRCCAAHLQGTNVYQQDFRKPTCFFIGNEGNGLTDELSELADVRLQIPMLGRVESLNAATAATVLMYEALRQNM